MPIQMQFFEGLMHAVLFIAKTSVQSDNVIVLFILWFFAINTVGHYFKILKIIWVWFRSIGSIVTIFTLFVNESILDINYPELLTAVIYDINAYSMKWKRCSKTIGGENVEYTLNFTKY